MSREEDRTGLGCGDGAETAETSLSQIAWEWRATLDAMSDMIAIIDEGFRFTRANRALSVLLKREPRDLIGRHCYTLMHGSSEPWPHCPHRQALDERRSVTREIIDDHIGLPLLVKCTPFHDAQGRMTGTVHVSRDISAQKQYEKARENLIKERQQALARVRALKGMLPICLACRKIRNDRGYWQQVGEYFRQHPEVDLSHAICPACREELYPDLSEAE